MRQPRTCWAIACALLLASSGLALAGARAVEFDRPDAGDCGARGAGQAPVGIYLALGGDIPLDSEQPFETVQPERRELANPVDLRTSDGAVLFRYWVFDLFRHFFLLP